MVWTTDHSHIVSHHLAKGLHAGSQAKQLEARRNVSQRLDLQSSRRNGSECSRFIHGVAFLCGISTPSLSAQGEQRRSAFFNIRRDISLPEAAILLGVGRLASACPLAARIRLPA
jgi:hypothetical protein